MKSSNQTASQHNAGQIGESVLTSSSLLTKPGNDPEGITFRTVDYTGAQLAEVDDFPGVMAFIRDAAENKGMRFDKTDFPDGEIVCPNKNVAIFRGGAAKFLDRLFEGGVGRGAVVAGCPFGLPEIGIVHATNSKTKPGAAQ